MPFWNARKNNNDNKNESKRRGSTKQQGSSDMPLSRQHPHPYEDYTYSDANMTYQYTTMDHKGVKKKTQILSRQASDFSDGQTASSSVFMSASMMGRATMNQAMEVFPSHKFDVGRPVVVSPDDVAAMQKDIGMMTVEAGGFGGNNSGRNGSRASWMGGSNHTSGNVDAWIDVVNQHQQEYDYVGFHGRPPEDIIACHPNYKQKRRSSAPATANVFKDSAHAVANDMTGGVDVSPTNASDGNADQKKQVSEFQKKLSIQTKTAITAQSNPSPNQRSQNAVSPTSIASNSPKYATQRQKELMQAGADTNASHTLQVSSKTRSSRPTSNTRRRVEGESKPAIQKPPINRNATHNPTSMNMFSRSSLGLVSEVSSLSSMDSLPDLHEDLSTADWSNMHKNLTHLSSNSELILPALTTTDTDYCTPLHIAVWKAPPSLALLLLNLLSKTSAEISTGLLLSRDNSGNTPIHFCAGNASIDSIGIMAALIKAAPRALMIQNLEGDTPLHLAVSCPSIPLDCISMLLSTCPEACSLQDCNGGTPLHAAIANNASDDVILKILECAPNITTVVDNEGLLPLHYVGAFLWPSSSTVEKLIAAFPKAVVQRSKDGDVPLHTAVVNSNEDLLDHTAFEIIDLLLTSYESSDPLLMTNKEKSNPLHCGAIFNVSNKLIEFLMKQPSSRKASCMVNNSGSTPLHIAAAHSGVAKSVANVIALGTPEAAAVEDSIKGTPLHVACQNTHGTGSLIDVLFSFNPSAALIGTQRGHLPLHIAAQSPCACSASVIKSLIAHSPDAAKVRNKSGNTALHDAAKYRSSPEVIKMIYDAFPDALFIQNQYGNLPLHCATAYHESCEVVKFFLEKWPGGASIQNCNLDAPLHYATTNDASLTIIKAIIGVAPASVLLRNSVGENPLERAQANNAPNEIIDFLEEILEEESKRAFGASFDDSIPIDTAAEF